CDEPLAACLLKPTRQAQTATNPLLILRGVKILARLDEPGEVQARVEAPIRKFGGRIQQIGFDEAQRGSDVVDAGAVDSRQHDNVYFMALADQFAGDMRPDEPDPSCEEHFHKREPYWAV